MVTFALHDLVAGGGTVTSVNVPSEDVKLADERADELFGPEYEDDLMNFVFITVPDLTRLPFQDNSFDLVYACDIMAHLPTRTIGSYSPDILKVLTEMKRVTKPGGYMASRDIAAHHFFPEDDLGNLITSSLFRATGLRGWCGPHMPLFYRQLGFDLAEVHVDSTTTIRGHTRGDPLWASAYARKFEEGTETRERWIAAGVSAAKIDLIMEKLAQWGEMDHS
ncbi:hypothetical protein O1611_g5028 [Lasiodiplodia mahajangana]|uniref:Uncharacterized protein n=1 Tax=Lasiodiplodia mahajangana TaxID=1108764 RepID=A0ACC2JMA3_9PEZI|nr:hypothetical protein O1611_g5028 [Lasiodiplodia mahajangana]